MAEAFDKDLPLKSVTVKLQYNKHLIHSWIQSGFDLTKTPSKDNESTQYLRYNCL